MRYLFKRFWLMLLFIFAMVGGMTAQNSYVHVTIFLNDGTEASYDMENTSYMYFEEGVKLVITESSDGTNAVSYPLADIRKITCEEMVGTIENTTMGVSIYPNPVHDKLQIRNVTGNPVVNIYALDGRLVKSLQVTDNQNVDISDLPSGMYLVNISSSTFKMMKL